MSFNNFQSGFQEVISKLDEVGTTVQSAVSTLFKKDLHDLVSGIRANKANESKYINDCIQEIKEELKSLDHEEKATAVLKLTYLQMLGYNMDWASFRVIEVISQQEFSHKRIGYLAASQSFSESTDVMVLITNMIRKDCLSPNMYDGGIALNCLADICTTELARDLVADIVNMLSSARPYIRKKAVLVMYKIFLKFPDALRPSFPRLKEKLDDPDTAVISAAVNVICELAKKNARNYLPLAPTLFKLLTKSSNNWTLIKVIKLFALLIPLEERLGKKLADPLCNTINSTNSMSLMYEAIYTCIVGLSSYRNVMQLCSSKLRMFIEHPDQNLKYLGLLALSKIMEVFPKGTMEHRDIILNCLEDEDQTIRLRAVELLTGMVDKKNLAFIVDKLKHYLDTAEGAYRDDLLEKIIYICSQEKYKFITDFEWYLALLVDLTHVKGVKNGNIVSAQILDVCVRVKLVREVAVRQMLLLLKDRTLLTEDVKAGSMCEALYAAAWVVGEYADLCEEHHVAIDTLTQSDVTGLPAHIQSIYIHNALKVFGALTLVGAKSPENPLPQNPDLDESINLLKARLPLFTSSPHIEVQERASFFEQLLHIFEDQRAKGINIGDELAVVTADALNPVSLQAQERVPKPDNLDLDAWINEAIPEEEEDPYGSKASKYDYFPDGNYQTNDFSYDSRASEGGGGGYEPSNAPHFIDHEKVERNRAQHLKNMVGASKFYIDTETSEPTHDLPPLHNFATDFPLIAPSMREQLAPSPRGRGARVPRGRGGGRASARFNESVTILTEDENPIGWSEKESTKNLNPKKSDALADIDLTKQPDEEVFLPVLKHYTVVSQAKPIPPSMVPPTGVKAPPAARGGRTGQRGRGRGSRIPSTARGGRTGQRGRGRGGRILPRGGEGRGRAPVSEKPPVEGAPPESNEGNSGTVAARRPGGPGGPGAVRKGPNPLRITPLWKDKSLDIALELMSSKTQKNRILAVFILKNTSEVNLEKIQFTFTNTDNFRLAPHPERQTDDPIPTGFTLPPSGTNILKVPFEYNTFLPPQQIKGTVEYVEGTNESSERNEFDMTFPCSAFILPENVETNTLINLFRSDTNEMLRSPQINTTLQKAAARICGVFRVKVVEEDNEKVSLYGKTVHDNHVVFLIKIDGGEEQLRIAIKSDNDSLAENLLQELLSLKW